SGCLKEALPVSFTMADFRREYFRDQLHMMTPEERLEMLAELPLEVRLAGLSPEQIQEYLERLTSDQSRLMHEEQPFLQAIHEHPEALSLRLVFADWREERGDRRGELLRLLHTLTQSVRIPKRRRLEDRLRRLLADRVPPVGPFWTNSLGMRLALIPA